MSSSEFLKYKVGVGSMGGVAEGVSGVLWVHLLAGRGLKAAGRPEFRDLYCVLECDRVFGGSCLIYCRNKPFM